MPFKTPSLMVPGSSGATPSSTNFLAPSSMTNLQTTQPQIISSQGEKAGTKYKVALQPGHSPMDWARLVNIVKPKPMRSITESELARHNTKNDCWMSYEGIVYDVTKYISFHPGGVEEIMRGKGRDMTALFNEVHQWVNMRNMLKKLANIGKIDLKI